MEEGRDDLISILSIHTKSKTKIEKLGESRIPACGIDGQEKTEGRRHARNSC